MKRTREELMEVFQETLTIIQSGGYRTQSGQWIELGGDPKKGSRFYQSLKPIERDDLPVFKNPKVYVENIDTFQKAEVLGPGCAVLNMASFQNASGGVLNGSRAQEEELCRRSNLVQSLYAYSTRDCNLLGYPEPRNHRYPIPMYGGIYSPEITVFRSALSYSLLERPFRCSVISVPALKRPETDRKTGMLTETGALIMKGKIRAILRIALLKGHTKLVLGALGCGAYGNPPAHIALLFKEVLSESEFWGHFEEICFAILEDGNSLKNQSGGNLKPFKEVFGG